ncbi:hypothetical protein ACFWHX_31830 [Streptomyces hirsutus]|uniref:hypothetical protein n=1 Tax=Streptomyces hirsutus TaxID=35620 RepID=UPI0036638CE3
MAWNGPERPGDWTAVERTFREGHTETWWAADARLGWWGLGELVRLVVATADPSTLPPKATWYLVTDLTRPGAPRPSDSPCSPADLAEVVRIYGLRHWVEQSYKQIKDELRWADFQVCSGTAIRRHQALVTCAFFCRNIWFASPPPARAPPPEPAPAERDRREPQQPPPPCRPQALHASVAG